MRRDGNRFLAYVLVTGSAVAGFVYEQQLLAALIAGAVGLLLHGVLTPTRSGDTETADSSYFFGFLLTLIFLVTGLATLGSRSAGQLGPSEILGFLQELGAGLALTIVGLVLRQVRTLWGVETSAAVEAEPLSSAHVQLAEAVRALALQVSRRPDDVVAAELNATRAKAREVTEHLEQTVMHSAGRVEGAMQRLEDASNQVSSSLLRVTSGLGDTVTNSVGRFELEVAAVLSALQTRRRELDDELRGAQEHTAQTRQQMAEQMTVQVEEWKATLMQSQRYLAAAQDSIDGEYQRGLTSLTAAGSAFHELALRVGGDINALPNPAERLAGLWDGVRSLESTLEASLLGASEQLVALTARSRSVSESLAELERRSDAASGAIEESAAGLARGLREELNQIDGILDEYTRLFRRKIAVS